MAGANSWALSATVASTLKLRLLSHLDLFSRRWLFQSVCIIIFRSPPPIMATGNPTGLSADQLQEVLKTVKDGLRDEVALLKRELASDREVADDRLLKRLKMEKAPSFKKTHEKQYFFNEEVSTKMEAAASSLSQTPPAVEKAKTQLEGLKFVCERQKVI